MAIYHDISELEELVPPPLSESVRQEQKKQILARTIYAPWYHEISWFNLTAFCILSCYSALGTQAIFIAIDNSDIFISLREILTNTSKISSPINLSIIYISLLLVGSALFFQSMCEQEV